MKTNKILVVVEGEEFEVKLLRSLFRLFNIKRKKYEIVSYRANIYDLYFKIKNDEFFDLKNFLKSRDSNLNLEGFDEILLFFDLDIHHTDVGKNTVYSKEIIQEMLQLFNDEFGNGKLYINYPMVESYKDVDSYENRDYYQKVISLEESSYYKKLVGETKSLIDSHKGLEKKVIDYIIFLNLTKKNFLLSTSYQKPTYEEYSSFSEEELFVNIHGEYISKRLIPVLSSIVLIVLEYISNEERNAFLK